MYKIIFYFLVFLSLISCEKDQHSVCGEIVTKPDPIINPYNNTYDYFLLVRLKPQSHAWIIVTENDYNNSEIGNYICGQPNN